MLQIFFMNVMTLIVNNFVNYLFYYFEIFITKRLIVKPKLFIGDPYFYWRPQAFHLRPKILPQRPQIFIGNPKLSSETPNSDERWPPIVRLKYKDSFRTKPKCFKFSFIYKFISIQSLIFLNSNIQVDQPQGTNGANGSNGTNGSNGANGSNGDYSSDGEQAPETKVNFKGTVQLFLNLLIDRP